MTVQSEPNGASGAVKTAAAAALVVAGCAACCAPLIAAPVLGLLSAAGVGLALLGKIGLGVLVMTGIGIYLLARTRRSSRLAKGCECAPDSGCHVADACDLPANNNVRSKC